MRTALVCGARGFIGGHIATWLKHEGFWVRRADLKLPEFTETAADDFVIGDLRDEALYRTAVGRKFDEVYGFAAEMDGAGYIFARQHDANVMHDSAAVDLDMVETCRKRDVQRIFYSPSACMYLAHSQERPDNTDCTGGSAYRDELIIICFDNLHDYDNGQSAPSFPTVIPKVIAREDLVLANHRKVGITYLELTCADDVEADPSAGYRRVLEHLGLDFEPARLTPKKTSVGLHRELGSYDKPESEMRNSPYEWMLSETGGSPGVTASHAG